MKEKMKKFTEDHKKEIKLATFFVSGMVLGGVIGYRKGNNVPPNLMRILYDARKKYGTNNMVFSGILQEGFKPEDLGKLGDEILNLDDECKVEFTHFIAIGK